MINRLEQSDYLHWLIMKSYVIPNTAINMLIKMKELWEAKVVKFYVCTHGSSSYGSWICQMKEKPSKGCQNLLKHYFLQVAMV